MNDTIIHSDQGSSYTSYDYRDYLLSLGVKQSCSDVGECWDNAAMESLNRNIKMMYNRGRGYKDINFFCILITYFTGINKKVS